MSESQHFILRVRYTVIGRGPQLTLPPSGLPPPILTDSWLGPVLWGAAMSRPPG